MDPTPTDDVGYDSDSEEDNEESGSVELSERKENPDLPDTVTVLEYEDESLSNCLNVDGGEEAVKLGKLYLIGTAHFSTESQDDVRKTIRETQPDLVMVELCHSRVAILSMDEEKLLNEAKQLNYEKIMSNIKQSGFVQGIMYCMMLSMSAHITKQLGMAPGGEFRAAFQETRQVPGCRLHLGDRPIQVTLQRAFGALSLWQKLRLFCGILWSHGMKITKEDIEKAKRQDLLEEVLREMAGEFPELSKIFVNERDQYMAYVLRCLLKDLTYRRAQQKFTEGDTGIYRPVVIVGVVGMGHLPGIVSNWKTPTNDVQKLLEVPQKSKWPRYFKIGLKGFIIGLASYALYRGGSGLYKYLKPEV